jgi:hypothetical protein
MASRYNKVYYLYRGNGVDTGYFGIAQRAPSTLYPVGKIVRSKDTNYRIYVCVVGGTSSTSADASWSTSIYSETLDGTIRWMELGGGRAPLNGDFGNTMNWFQAKAYDPVAQVGAIITSGTAIHVTRNGGTMGASLPSFSDVPGSLAADGSITWTSLGPYANFPGGGAPFCETYNLHEFWATGPDDTIYIAHDNVERPSNTYIGGNTERTFMRMISHNRFGNYPPTPADFLPGATYIGNGITVGWRGTSWLEGINFIGDQYGGMFIGAQNSSLRNDNWMYLKNCTVQMVNTAYAYAIRFGPGGQPTYHQTTICDNTKFFFANTNSYFEVLGANVIFKNTQGSILMPSSIPVATLWRGGYDYVTPNVVTFEGIDLSAHPYYLYEGAGGNSGSVGQLQFKDCRFNAATQVAERPNFSVAGFTVQTSRCSDSAYWHKTAREAYEGSETTEDIIYRIGGAADPTKKKFSRKIVTSPNSTWWRPFKAEPFGTWSIRTGSIIVQVHGTINAIDMPTNEDIWIEVEYLNTFGNPMGTIKRATKLNILSVGTPHAADTFATWTGNADTLPMAWEPSTPTDVSLTNNNLTAQNTGSTSADQGTKCGLTLGQSTGKYYHEVTLNVLAGGFNVGTGVAGIASTYTNFGNSGTGGANFYFADGRVYLNGSNPGVSLGARVANDVIGIATDLDNRKIWFRKVSGTPSNWNNSGTADPATNVGGLNLPTGVPMIPFATFGGSSGNAGNRITLNCGQNLYTLLARPAGFGNWTSYWKHFKMATSVIVAQAGYIHARVRAAKPNTTWYIDPKLEISR